MNEKNRNYRMFKKRYAEMDLYQEFRRSHERVKVMLSESMEEKNESDSTLPSAQENLQRFIKQHESKEIVPETEYENVNSEQNFIDLENETITPERTGYSSSEVNNNLVIPNQERDMPQENFIAENQQFVYDFASSPLYESPRPIQENYNLNQNTQHNMERSIPTRSNKVEDELDTIIREALNKVSPITNIHSSDVDPELLSMLKKLLIKKDLSPEARTDQFSINLADTISQGEFIQNYVFSQIQNNPISNETSTEGQLNSTEKGTSRPKSASLDQQVNNEKVPPKLPSNKSTVKRPETKEQIGVFDPAFSSIELDEDSSLALTKKEISMQVKN